MDVESLFPTPVDTWKVGDLLVRYTGETKRLVLIVESESHHAALKLPLSVSASTELEAAPLPGSSCAKLTGRISVRPVYPDVFGDHHDQLLNGTLVVAADRLLVFVADGSAIDSPKVFVDLRSGKIATAMEIQRPLRNSLKFQRWHMVLERASGAPEGELLADVEAR